MLRSYRPDIGPSIRSCDARHVSPLFKYWAPNPNSQKVTGRTATKWPDAGPQRPIVSSKVPNVNFHDRTRPVMLDRTHPALGHLAFPLCMTMSVWPDATSQHPVVSAPVSGRWPTLRFFYYYWPDASVLQRPASDHLQWPRSPEFRTSVAPSDYLHSMGGHSAGEVPNPCSNVPTTKCITLCTCVSIFSRKFSRVLALH